jgi:chemotaxis protein CheX
MVASTEIAKPFIKATRDILSMMAGMEATFGAPYVKKGDAAKGDVSAIVGVTGDMRGSIAVSFSKDAARALVEGMLGDAIEDLAHDTQDAVGEVMNMISGQARAGLVEIGITVQGSTPTVIMGDGHQIRHISESPVMVIPFSTQHGDFTVEFCLS